MFFWGARCAAWPIVTALPLKPHLNTEQTNASWSSKKMQDGRAEVKQKM
jgi:hypothetical protein